MNGTNPQSERPKITDRPAVIFLSAVVAAFVAGITAWIFLTNQIQEKARAAVLELKTKGELLPGPAGPPGPPGIADLRLLGAEDTPLIAKSDYEVSLPKIPVGKRALLLVTGAAQGTQTNAGEALLVLTVSISLDGTEIAFDQSSIYHYNDRPQLRACAVTSVILNEAPIHKLKVAGSGGQITVEGVSLRYQVIELPK